MKCNPKLFLSALLSIIGLTVTIGSSGCVSGRSYSYESIRNEYAPPVVYGGESDGRPAFGKQAAIEGAVNLKEAIGIAVANSPDNMTAVARIRRAEAELRMADAVFYPSVGLYTEYLEGDAPSAYLFRKIDQRELPPDAEFNDPGRIRNFESGATARFNLYNGGKDILNRMAAETGVDIFRLDRRAVENALVASVIATYYDALAAEAFIGIAEDSVKTVQAQLRIMNVRYLAGGALKSDILSLEVRLAEAREEAVIAKNRYKKTLTALAEIMGISPEPPVSLVKEDTLPARLPEQYQGGLAMALEKRPELEKIRKKVIQSRIALDRAKAGYLPRIDLEGRYYLDDENLDYDIDRDNWTVGVMLNWDIFTGFSTAADETRAKAALQEALSADRKTALSIEVDVKNAYLNAEAARARLTAAETAVAAAEESLVLVKKQYEGGSATITRYLQAELDRNRARTRSTAAFYDRDKALANIGRAVGHWSGYRPETISGSLPEQTESE